VSSNTSGSPSFQKKWWPPISIQHFLRFLRHDQRIVEADHAGGRAPVRLDLGAARQDAEQRSVHARDPADRRIGVGHRGGVLLDLVAPDLHQEGAPGAAGNVEVARMDLVQGGNLFVVAEQVGEVVLDLGVALLELGQHGKGLQRIGPAERQFRHAAQDHVRHFEVEVLYRLLRHPNMLGQVEAAFLAGICVISFHGRGPGAPDEGGNFLRVARDFKPVNRRACAADRLNFLRQASENM
jgi:hypothetical protein